MFIKRLPSIQEYITHLGNELQLLDPNLSLSILRQKWLSFTLSGMLLTGTLNWKGFERMSLGTYSFADLSWMFRKATLPWSDLLNASTSLLMRKYNLNEGVLVLDDTDLRRAKTTSRIYGTHKVYDKKTGGYFNGQCIMSLVLVTKTMTIPLGMRFYRPDPKYRAWEKADKLLIKAGVKPADRPKPPERDPNFPSKEEIALVQLGDFHRKHPDFIVKAVLADAAFGTHSFMEGACKKAGCKQVISQLRENQHVVVGNSSMPVKEYFSKREATSQTVLVRGGKLAKMTVIPARLVVKAHGVKRAVIAVKNEGEADFRYIVATDMTWRDLDILQGYTLRWLVEVVFQDWKTHEGWANLAKHPDEDGSVRGVILSLLLDHALLLHPAQQTCFENSTPANTVGSLKRAAEGEAMFVFASEIASDVNPSRMVEQLAAKFKTYFPLSSSKKHMSGRDLGRQEPMPALNHHAIIDLLDGMTVALA